MISLKASTKAYADSPQTLSGAQADRTRTLSADEREQLFGGEENVGDFLNKIADPNFAPKKFREVGKNTLGKDDFLKLMLAQMKNQDPTNTMDAHEMASQMAQFTSLEQLSNINRGIENLGAKSSSGGNFDALNFIGKVVSGDSSKLYRATNEDKHVFNFDLTGDATDITVKVKDSQNEVVKTLQLKNLKKGKNSVPWNGLTEDGFRARTGDYHFEVEAKASNGRKIHAETKFDGKISGVQFTPAGPILLIGDQQVRLTDVNKIVDPTLTEGQKSKDEKSLDLSQSAAKSENEENDEVKSAPAQAEKGNVGSLAMNKKFMDKLEKATK